MSLRTRVMRFLRRQTGRGRCSCGANGQNECPCDYPGDCNVSWIDAATWERILALPRQPLPGKPLPLTEFPVCCCSTNPRVCCPIHGSGNGPQSGQTTSITEMRP